MHLTENEMTQIKAVIVGAGLGGLSCAIACRREGLETLLLEKAAKFESVGAGIQLPPNATRAMDRLGLLDAIKSRANVVDEITVRRYSDGSILTKRPLGTKAIEEFSALWYVIHRADYHEILLQAAQDAGVQVILDQHVTEIDVENGQVQTEQGRVWKGDVVIGADGVWSNVRNKVQDVPVHPQETGDLAYRGTFRREQLLALNDPRIEELCAKSTVTIWVGPNKHAVFYPVRRSQAYNLILVRPDNLPSGIRTAQGDIGEMKATFENWDPVLTRIISCIPSVLKWKLCHFSELQIWSKGRAVLLGDACHPTLPYQAQGAAMAVEDGVTLGHLLGIVNRKLSSSKAATSDLVKVALKVYEKNRKVRTTLNVAGAVNNREFYHMEDGEQQQERDAELRGFDWNSSKLKPSRWKWLDTDYQRQLLGYDSVVPAVALLGDTISLIE